MDLSHWNLVDQFSLSEAAHLAAGADPLARVPPDAPTQSRIALYERELEAAFRIAYGHAWEILRPLREPPPVVAPDIWEYDAHVGELPTNDLRDEFAAALADPAEYRLRPLSLEEPYYGKFLRDDLAGWFSLKGIQPRYNFAASRPTPADPSVSPGAAYVTPWLALLNEAIRQFFSPRRNPDAKREEVIEWINSRALQQGMAESDRIAKAIFTIIAPPDHNPKRRRDE